MPFFAEGLRSMSATYFWPLLFYFILESIKTIGGVYTLTNFLIAILPFYIGKKATKLNKKRILNTGEYLHSSSLFIRFFAKSFAAITLIQSLGGISWAMLHLPFQGLFYEN